MPLVDYRARTLGDDVRVVTVPPANTGTLDILDEAFVVAPQDM
jgi:hypothetical protein